MKRILNLTHSDMDGIASGVAIRLAHGGEHVTTQFVNYDSVHRKLADGLKARTPYDRIILSDISIKTPDSDLSRSHAEIQDLVRNELPQLIRRYVDEGGELVVLDHHRTALPMKSYFGDLLDSSSILQEADPDGVKRAGSELAGRYMQAILEAHRANSEYHDLFEDEEFEIIDLMPATIELCRLAGDRDVWRDPLGFGGRLALAVDLMDDAFGAMLALEDLVEVSASDKVTLEEALSQQEVLEYYYRMASDRLDSALKLTDRDKRELGPRLHLIETRFFPDDCAMNIYEKTRGVVLVRYPDRPDRISFRRHISCKVDLSEFCAKYGGGGHSEAAGMTLPEGIFLDDVIQDLESELAKLG